MSLCVFCETCCNLMSLMSTRRRRGRNRWGKLDFFLHFLASFFYWCLLRENHNGNLLRTGSNGENFYGCIFLLSWGSATITKKKCTTRSEREIYCFLKCKTKSFSLMMEEFLKDCLSLIKVDFYWLLVATASAQE